MSETAQDNDKYARILRASFDYAPVPMLLIGLTGKVLKFNDAVSELTGYEREEIEGLAVTELPFILPEDVSVVRENFLRRVKGEELKPYNLKVQTKSGDTIMGKVSGSLVKSSAGVPEGAIVVVADVTEDVDRFSSVQSYSERVKHYLDVVDDMILELDLDGKVGLINKAGLELLGYEESSQIVGKDWFVHVPEERKEEVRRVFHDLLSGSKEHEYYENTILDRSGNHIDIRWHSLTYENEEGKVVALVSYGKDVTRERKISTSLKDVEGKLSIVMEHSSEIYYMNSVEHDKLEFVSPQCEEVLGYTQEEMKENWTSILTDSPINNEGIEKTRKALETGEKQPRYLLEVKTKEGEIKTLEVDESPIKDEEGKVVGLGGVIRDVTDRVENEKELRERIEQFESMNRVVVGRELKMVKLKEKVKKLEAKVKRLEEKNAE